MSSRVPRGSIYCRVFQFPPRPRPLWYHCRHSAAWLRRGRSKVDVVRGGPRILGDTPQSQPDGRCDRDVCWNGHELSCAGETSGIKSIRIKKLNYCYYCFPVSTKRLPTVGLRLQLNSAATLLPSVRPSLTATCLDVHMPSHMPTTTATQRVGEQHKSSINAGGSLAQCVAEAHPHREP